MAIRTRFAFLLLLTLAACSRAPEEAPKTASGPPWAEGRWDVTVKHPEGSYPSWFELRREDGNWQGRFVGRWGSARPIASIEIDGDRLRFSLPVQYEEQSDDLRFEGEYKDGEIHGQTNVGEDASVPFVAVPAPKLEAPGQVRFAEEPIDLLADGLEGWRLREPDGPNGWRMEEGVLINEPPSVDLISKREFGDFKLSLEFYMPEGSNSGVYLRGQYEVQIQDDHGQEPHSRRCGGVYGFITPSEMACKPAGEWNRYEITLLGRRITVELNGTTIIGDEEIPGITGGALSSEEDGRGPIMLQGDHEAVRFRNIKLWPANGGG